jgi:hypothetical protein
MTVGVLGTNGCSSSSKGTKAESACDGFCQAFDSGSNCSGAKTQCANDCGSVVSHCPSRASAMLDCLADLSYSCTSPGEAHATGSNGSGGTTATLSSGAGTLYVDDPYCAQLVQEFNDCTPVNPGGGGAGGGFGGTGGSPDGGAGGTGSGGAGGSGAGGAGGSGGGGQPDLANVDFSFTATAMNKDPNGEGGPAVPYEVKICLNPQEANYLEVKNIGTGDAGPFKVGVQLMNGQNVVGGCQDFVESDPLPPNGTTSWTNQWCCPVNDTISSFDLNMRTIRAVADVDDQVSEADESNNTGVTPEFEVKSLPQSSSQ